MKLSEIAEFLSLDYAGEDMEITGLNSLHNANFNELSYCDGRKNAPNIASTGAGAILINKEFESLVPKDTKILISPNPHLSFAYLSKLFAKELLTSTPRPAKIAKSAVIMPNVYIGSGVEIGENVVVMAGAYIGDNVSIGDFTLVHPNVVIYNDTKIGKKCHLLANCVIGSDGFGYAHNDAGEHYKIYHNGNVVLEDGVEIGACTTIDRAVFDSTVIKAGSKIDNLVQIGHNCKIGQNCLIVSQTWLSGSTELGKNVVMGGQSASAGHLSIGDYATIAARGAAVKDLKGGQVYGGAPTMPQREWLRLQAKFAMMVREKK